MKLLADENIPLLMVRQLEEKGYDIKYISTENAGIPDEEVIDLANKEERVLITFDSDFGDLIFKKKKTIKTGVIFLRLGQFMPNEPGEIMLSLLEENKLDFSGKISVVTKETVRQRKIME
jgi:predicted nuclease of predicted toxin-antitoxin system